MDAGGCKSQDAAAKECTGMRSIDMVFISGGQGILVIVVCQFLLMVFLRAICIWAIPTSTAQASPAPRTRYISSSEAGLSTSAREELPTAVPSQRGSVSSGISPLTAVCSGKSSSAPERNEGEG
ncbi:hypothetical protein GOP47_0020550 [Adiantum capillus-veneris]|uniref:Uncharacterized protein n=1 Tax=Adiantum capillus-veneris TaxID=13818 RepID=A0A9D4Z7J7_ADICA|nr:hypothetical protein GOP47_0020550 [Adiantum capillus-veneris]